MPKVFITRQIPDVGINLLKEKGYEVIVGPEGPTTPEEVMTGAKGADAIVAVLTERIDKAVMDAAGPQLKVIANYAVGYNNVDVPAAKEKNIMVTNTPGVLTNAVVEHTIALILAVADRIPEADKYCRDGKFIAWGPKLLLGADITGKTIGIVGFGRIGSEIGRKMKSAFDMKLLYNDVKRNEELEKSTEAIYLELNDLLSQSDFVSLNVALTPETTHLINAGNLRLMKLTAYLINTSRGPVIDEKSLVAALQAKQIAGAALDVYEKEPQIEPELLQMDNVVLAPHIASATEWTRNKMAEMAAQNAIAILEGQTPPNPIPEMI